MSNFRIINEEQIAEIKKYHEIRRHIKQLEVYKKDIENKIKKFIGENESLVDNDGNEWLSYKHIPARLKIDEARLKEEMPDIFEKYSKEVAAHRRFDWK